MSEENTVALTRQPHRFTAGAIAAGVVGLIAGWLLPVAVTAIGCVALLVVVVLLGRIDEPVPPARRLRGGP